MSRRELVSRNNPDQGIVSPNDIVDRLDFQHQKIIPNLDIPIKWYEIRKERGFIYNDVSPIIGALGKEDILPLGTSLFDINPVILYDTYGQAIGKDKIRELSGWEQEFGHMAFIFMYRIRDQKGKSSYFTTYVSRYPEGTERAKAAKRDFQDLQFLSTRFNTGLKEKYKQKFGVVYPIALGTTQYNQKSYPFFTMPFVPFGELNFNVFEVMDDGEYPVMVFFFLSYSKPLNRKMKETIEDQRNTAQSMAREYYNTALDREHLENTRASIIVKKQLDDILLGNMLVYLLSGNRLPKDFLINAGDWMGVINDRGLLLKLISVSGGFDEPISEKVLFKTLKYHDEPVSPLRTYKDGHQEIVDYDLPLFSKISEDRFKALLNQAKQMLK